MLRKFPAIYFWVTTVALSIAAGLFWLGAFRQVVGEEDLLFLPKTDRAIVASANGALLLQSSTLQDRIEQTAVKQLQSSSEIDGVKTVLVEGVVLEGSSVLRLTTRGSEQGEAKTWLSVATKELLQQLSQYYNFQTELDVRIMNGPQFVVQVSSWPLLILTSLATGFGVSILFFLFLSGLEYVATRTVAGPTEELAPHITPDTFRPQVVTPYWSRTEEAPDASSAAENDYDTLPSDESIPASSTEEEEMWYTDPNPADVLAGLPDTVPMGADEESQGVMAESEETNEVLESTADAQSLRGVATGPAPDNLPVSDLSPLEAATARLYKADIDATTQAMATQAEATLTQSESLASVEPQTTEPSQEEYKRRLNELLSGKL